VHTCCWPDNRTSRAENSSSRSCKDRSRTSFSPDMALCSSSTGARTSFTMISVGSSVSSGTLSTAAGDLAERTCSKQPRRTRSKLEFLVVISSRNLHDSSRPPHVHHVWRAIGAQSKQTSDHPRSWCPVISAHCIWQQSCTNAQSRVLVQLRTRTSFALTMACPASGASLIAAVRCRFALAINSPLSGACSAGRCPCTDLREDSERQQTHRHSQPS
jgi:hypothetical protein